MIEFLTFQTIILVLLKLQYNIEILNLHFLTFLLLLGGCYITFVKQFLIIKYGRHKQIDISGKVLKMSNILFHILPFIYIWLTYKTSRNMLFETYVYLLCYYYLFNPHKVYYIEDTMVYTLNSVLSIIAFFYYILI
jgi:hypothetical protein